MWARPMTTASAKEIESANFDGNSSPSHRTLHHRLHDFRHDSGSLINCPVLPAGKLAVLHIQDPIGWARSTLPSTTATSTLSGARTRSTKADPAVPGGSARTEVLSALTLSDAQCPTRAICRVAVHYDAYSSGRMGPRFALHKENPPSDTLLSLQALISHLKSVLTDTRRNRPCVL
jgi:hypothetical protein